MVKSKGNLEVKHFAAPSRQKQYLLSSGSEAATIDVGEAIEDVGLILADRGALRQQKIKTN